MEYVKGMTHDIRWGGPWGSDGSKVMLYGDLGNPAAAQWAMDAACAQHPAEAGLSDHQKVAFNFRFAKSRKYREVLELSRKCGEQAKAAGWPTAPAIDDLPDTGSSINDLSVDPLEDRDGPGGYNLCRGFTLVVERIGTKPEFSTEEIGELRSLACMMQREVFGTELPEMDL